VQRDDDLDSRHADKYLVLKDLLLAGWPGCRLRPVCGCCSLTRAVFRLFDGKPFDIRLAFLLFVGLFALTVPYIVVMKRVRLTGWVVG
jgi:hypothetical protein